ncbi:BCL2/adenovirus E1B 19 kDa protein-interacting protein 3-like [Ciona intestinalis]
MSDFSQTLSGFKPNEEHLGDSWVDLASSNVDTGTVKYLQYSYNSEMEKLLREAQREGSTPSVSHPSSVNHSNLNSPPHPQSLAGSTNHSPCLSGTNSPKYQGQTQLDDVSSARQLPSPTNVDWVWDWSSKPTNSPPMSWQFKHPKRKGTPLSMRNSAAMKHDIFSWEFMQVFIPSIILTNIMAFGIGVYIGKRLATATARNT